MVTSAGLPESLTEFLDLWCEDLLRPLGDEARRRVVNDVHLMCEGGIPWPTRLHVQRMAEVASGRITEEALQGELIDLHDGGVEGALTRLRDPDLHGAAVHELARLQPSVEMVRKVTVACRRGDLTEDERVRVLDHAMRLPVLPPAVPLPRHLVPVPPGHPVAACRSRVHAVGLGRHAARPVPAMASYVPQRVTADDGWVSFESWAATRADAPESVEPRRRREGVDSFLLGRGWSCRRVRDLDGSRYDEWVWPPSEGEAWGRPTTIDFDGVRFRVRLAAVNVTETPREKYVTTAGEIRREIAMIEAWSERIEGGRLL